MDRVKLYQRHQALATVLASRLERFVRPPWTREDMHQAAHLALIVAIADYHAQQPRGTSVAQYAAPRIFRAVRPFTRHKPVTELADIPVPPAPAEFEMRQDLIRLAVEVGHLPEMQRAAVVLRHDDGLPLRDVAERLNLSISGTKLLLLKAYSQLRQQLS
jgi:RNA polymerase sigma factor (sigma-70 family)